MDRLEPSREALLFALLDLMREGSLPADGRFLAAEVRTMGGAMLLLAAHGPSPVQPKLEGFLFSDLRGLARAGLIEADPHEKSLDVLMLRAAHRYAEQYRRAPATDAEPPPPAADRPGRPAPRNTAPDPPTVMDAEFTHDEFTHDAFISHAHADRDAIARPLAEELRRRGFRVWYDEWSLTVGDRLREKIDDGLRLSRYGIVILSPAFFASAWTQTELDALVVREGHDTVVLPVWHEVSSADIKARSPILASRIGVRTTHGLAYVADQLANVMRGREAGPPPASGPLAPVLPDFSRAPMLRWLDPAATLVNLSPALEVWCENSGHATSTAVVIRRWADMNRPDASSTWEPLEFEQFNVPSYIHSIHGADPRRRFLVRMRANRHARELGPLLIRWSVLYMDNELETGFVTTASVLAHFDGPGPAHLTDQALDVTNARARYERYLTWTREHGLPST